MRDNLKLAIGLALLAAGGYYFSFFLYVGDGSGIYLSATYSRIDLLLATAVLWCGAVILFTGALCALGRITSPILQRVLIASFTALGLTEFIRCYVKLAGFELTDQVLTIHGMVDAGPLQRWFLLIPSLAALVLYYKWPNATRPSLRFFALAGFVALPIGIARMWQTPVGRVQSASEYQVSTRSEITAGHALRRVIWIVLDEYDPQIAFSQADALQLTRWKGLRNHALEFTHAASPSGTTDISLPSMLIGKPASGITYNGPGLAVLHSNNGERIPFTTNNTVFGRLPDGPGSARILGYYHPYCQALQVRRCDSVGIHMGTRWFDGLANFVPKRFSGLLDPMTSITEWQLDLLRSYLSDSAAALTFVHLNIPHLPGHVAKQRLREDASDNADAYLLNLKLTDVVLSEVIQQLDTDSAEQGQLLILSSDHWFRSRGGTDKAYPALLLFKLRHDQEHLVLDKPVSSYHISQIVIEYLSGRLSSHREIMNWYAAQPYEPTWIPDARQ